MKTAQNNNKFVEKLIKNLDLDLTTNKAVDDAVCQDVLITHKRSMKEQMTARQRNIYRMIMKIPITKLSTAAAVIIIAVLSGIHYWPSLKNNSTYNQQPVEQFNPYIPKDSINAFSVENRADSDEDLADRDKEQTR
jgi:hypothetical protein